MKWLLSITIFFSVITSSCAATLEQRAAIMSNEGHRILVSADFWHSAVGIWPSDDPQGNDLATLEEWGFADKNYYYKGNSGIAGTLGALFWPTKGVLEVFHDGKMWSLEPDEGHFERWVFYISPDGHQALRNFLESSKETSQPLQQSKNRSWFDAQDSYHIFHNCHHWVAKALVAAGIPLDLSKILLRRQLSNQLDKFAYEKLSSE